MKDDSLLTVFIGSSRAPNISRVLDTLDEILNFEKHLITTNHGGELGYEIFGSEQPSTYRGEFQALSQYLSTHNPDAVLQITRPPTHGTTVGSLARRHDVPFIYRYSGDRFSEYRVARGRERLAAFGLGAVLGRIPIRLAARHIALGPTGKRRLIARGVAPERIIILPPAIDPHRFEDPDPPALNIPEDRKVILFVGRLSRLKGAETFERIIPRVLERRDDLHFLFVGSAEKKLSFPQSASEHVTYTSRVSPNDVPGYMATADVLAHPSLTEGVPRVLLEALAVGTPVLARDVGDVASVTDNTFETDDELVEELTGFESLQVDNVTRFTSNHLAPVYQGFFEQL